MTVSTADLILILRNVTGRVDNTDPQFTDEIMTNYLQNFITLSSTQEIRLFKNYTWWEFTFGPNEDNPYSFDLEAIELSNGGNIGASTIGPLCYASGFPVVWHEDPQKFYAIWPETQTYTPQRPTYVLYYNGSLTFRGPPDIDYNIKIQAYSLELQLTETGLQADYLYRYVAYGAALDIFSDFGELDRYNEIFPVFRRYRALVYSRTNSQYQSQRPSPEF
jgi:hypothetical protein